jgi:hypothetical protein
MSIKLEFLPEPKLQFGGYFEHESSKRGLSSNGTETYAKAKTPAR